MTVAAREVYTPDKLGDDYVVLLNNDTPYLTASPDPLAQQWTAWYADVLMQQQSVAWPLGGLQVFKSTDDEAMLFLWNGLPVGTIGWNGGEWWWHNLEHWGHQYGTSIHIEVSLTERRQFQVEHEAIATQPEHLRSALHAELAGRRRAFRDETCDLAELWGKARAMKVGRAYDANGVTFRCTGYWDQDMQLLDHNGDTCPVHESDGEQPLPESGLRGSGLT